MRTRGGWLEMMGIVTACGGAPAESMPTTSIGGSASAETSAGTEAPAGPETSTGSASAGGSISTTADTTDAAPADTGSSGDPSLGSSGGVVDPTTGGDSSSAPESSSGASVSVCDGPIAGVCPCIATSCCDELEACAADPTCGPYVDCVENSPDLVGCFAGGVPKAADPIVACFTNTCGFSC